MATPRRADQEAAHADHAVQMRYLIGSERGWLGGLGFGASAIKLGDRDQWIGWDTDQSSASICTA